MPQADGGFRSARAGSIAGTHFPRLDRVICAGFDRLSPLPPFVMDLLLSCNITLAVVILLTTVYVSRPLDFSVFPSVLLGTTLARLVLNVASTRLILTRGAEDGTAAAGHVIQAFGEFVAGGQLFIGFTIFAILIAIQFLVITKGATRISEVAARFALDGMPGKQMAIDADLNAGLITQEQARGAAKRSPNRPTSTERWTVPANSCAVMPLPVSSSRSSISWPDLGSASSNMAWT